MIVPLIAFLAVLVFDSPSAQARCAPAFTTFQLALEEVTLEGVVQPLPAEEDVRLRFVGGRPTMAELEVDGRIILLQRSGGLDGGAGE